LGPCGKSLSQFSRAINNENDLYSVEFKTTQAQTHRKHMDYGLWSIEYAVLSSAQGSEFPIDSVTFGFHGFARPLEDLLPVAKRWAPTDCFIGVHLLHHGQSQPRSDSIPWDHPISPSEMNKVLEAIAQREAPQAKQRKLFGYSIGGRVALALIHDTPQKWSHTLLMAPDGLKKSPFYRLTVHTRLGRWAWFFIDRNAALIRRLNARLHAVGLLSKHLYAFSEFHIESHEMRMMVWHGWRAHRLCWPTHRALSRAFLESNRIDLAFGDRDKIIPASNANRLKRLTRKQPHIHFHSIPSGHGMLREEVLDPTFQRIFRS
jgi:pimeloyl-ACP methyl ester carboxylesterase